MCVFCHCLVWVKVSSFLFCFHCFKQGGKGSLLCCLSFLWVIFILFSLLRVFARSLALLLLLFLSNPSTDVTRCWILVFFCFTLKLFPPFLLRVICVYILSYNLQKSTFVFLFHMFHYCFLPPSPLVQIPSRTFPRPACCCK